MSRGGSEERVWKAFVVDEFTDTSWDEYLRQTRTGDDGKSNRTSGNFEKPWR